VQQQVLVFILESALKNKHAIEEYTPTNMRSQVVKKENRTLVLDTYNANPSSMTASL
jgi:UDP-N-acetylmuramoyl-tripeptide--D-alanyl-D-alanine ligase